MNAFPKTLKNFPANCTYVMCVTAFFLLSALYFEPKSLCSLMMDGDADRTIPMVCVLIFVTLAVTRLVFFLLGNRLGTSYAAYCLWCFAEALAASVSVALYFTLSSAGDEAFFVFLMRTFSCLVWVFFFPFIILTLAYDCRDARSSVLESRDDERFEFHDHRNVLKFSVTSASVLYIESNENYVVVHYLDDGIEKTYQIRSSMKNLEPLAAGAGFVRVHRRYFINPTQVSSVRKDEDGLYFANLDAVDDIEIPVSKTYYLDLVSVL